MFSSFRYKLWVSGIFLFFSTQLLFAQLPPDFYDSRVVGGFQLPLGITFDDNGRGYVWEQAGTVHILDTTGALLPEPLIDLREEVSAWNDHGLNGFCLDNNFTSNGYIYLYYVVDMHHYWHYGTPAYHPDSTVVNKAAFGRVTRYQVDAGSGFTRVIPESRKVLLGLTPADGVPILFPFHGLGTLLQGTDGTLLCSAGESTGGTQIGIGNEPGDEFVPDAIAWGIITEDQDLGSYRSQYLGTLGGKIIRIDPETGDAPASNPFYKTDEPRSPQSRIWALGLRNPYRMVQKPNTGSHSPSDANPGTFLVGDVGNGAWEELNLMDRPGLNFGWPVYEGIHLCWKFWVQEVPINPTAPNPHNTCGIPFLNFRNLLAQPRVFGPYTPTNPCDGTLAIPDSLHPFYAQLPMIVWNNSLWNQPMRAAVPGWDQIGWPADFFIGADSTAVQGEPFQGFSSLAGGFYTGQNFPAEYQGKYIHFDFSGWIRVFEFDSAYAIKSIAPLQGYTRDPIHLTVNPVDGCVYYTNLAGEVRRISYGGNPPPVAVIAADVDYGASPLDVHLSALDSYDPNNTALRYLWDFGDGQTDTLPHLMHRFTAQGTMAESFEVRLTVTDEEGATNQTSRLIALNNTPPQVAISSFSDGDQYSVTASSLLRLEAEVIDAESPQDELSYEWRVYLHHNSHFHPEPAIRDAMSYLIISPIGCGDENYYYRIELTVTDPQGLSTTDSRSVYPDCSAWPILVKDLRSTGTDNSIELAWNVQSVRKVSWLEVQRSTDFLHFSTIGILPVDRSLPEWAGFQLEDKHPIIGTSTYRIKAVTSSGAFNYSEEFTISYPDATVLAYPNPARTFVNFVFPQTITPVVSLEIYNKSGQLLGKLPLDANNTSMWSYPLSVKDLPAGAYVYRVNTKGGQQHSGQFVVQ